MTLSGRLPLVNSTRADLNLAQGLIMLPSKIGGIAHVTHTALAGDFLPCGSASVFSLLVRYTHVDIPIVSGHSYETLLAAFLLLLAGNLFRGF